LPSDNDAFGGGKYLTLWHEDFPAHQDTQEVEIFFPRDATNHPGDGTGETPNWYYYWKTGAVVPDLIFFSYQPHMGRYGTYDPDTQTLYVCDLAPTQQYEYWVVNRNNAEHTEKIGSTGQGINCCAEVCLHELNHKLTWDIPGQDTDGDHVTDYDEINTFAVYGFDPTHPDTYNLAQVLHCPEYSLYGDNEFLARKAQQEPYNVCPEWDWSDTNGKNWGQ